MARLHDISGNLSAFLDMVAYSEIGPDLLALPSTDDGYKVIVGSTLHHPRLMKDYHQHPHIVVDLGHGLKSTAAGRYQCLGKYADHYIDVLQLPDFGPESQDRIAKQLIAECKATPYIESGHIDTAISLCRSRWASLPGAGYSQHENKVETLLAAYEYARGRYA